jgi:thioredoxin reductase (NADPH)
MEDKTIFAEKPAEGQPWDVIIIGSGPAAFTAAIYTTRGAASTLIIGGDSWGGQLMLTTTVDNFPGFPDGVQGPELMSAMKKQAERFGTEFIGSNVLSVDFAKKPFEIKTNDKTYPAKTVIIATGAVTKWLEVAGEKELIGRGVSSCAPCDAPFFKDKEVAVVGGGDSAMEEALVLTKYAKQVTVIHRRDELKASAAMQQRANANDKIKFIWSTEVSKMIGEQRLEKLELKTLATSEEGRRVLKGEMEVGEHVKLKEENGYVYWTTAFDGVFVAIGHIPATEIFKGKIDTDDKGYIIKRGTGSESEIDDKKHYHAKTNIEGVFVAGDVHDHEYRQAVTASGFGCMAGMDALRYLDKPAPNW